MNESTKKRIHHDIKQLQEISDDISLEVTDLKNIQCILKGPLDTIYETGLWRICIEFPDKYPYKSPSIGFLDKIWHPNVDFHSGSVCLNSLNEDWRPIYTIKHVITTFLPQLLTYPNPDDPLNVSAAHQYSQNKEDFDKHVLNTIQRYSKKD